MVHRDRSVSSGTWRSPARVCVQQVVKRQCGQTCDSPPFYESATSKKKLGFSFPWRSWRNIFLAAAKFFDFTFFFSLFFMTRSFVINFYARSLWDKREIHHRRFYKFMYGQINFLLRVQRTGNRYVINCNKWNRAKRTHPRLRIRARMCSFDLADSRRGKKKGGNWDREKKGTRGSSGATERGSDIRVGILIVQRSNLLGLLFFCFLLSRLTPRVRKFVKNVSFAGSRWLGDSKCCRVPEEPGVC